MTGSDITPSTCRCPPAADVVTAIHVLEHVDAAHGMRIRAEATRIARRRVVVAVPLEDEPNAAVGHVRAIGLDDLDLFHHLMNGGMMRS